jgi:hypothetical protein
MINNNQIPIKIMAHNQILQIEKGCYGRMALENGKIVFELQNNNSSIPQPNAPPLILEDPLVDELRNELHETKQRLANLEKRVQEFFTFNNHASNSGYNFECDKIKFYECMHNQQYGGCGFKVTLGDENRLYGHFGPHYPDIMKGVKSFRNLRTICLDFSYELNTHKNPSMQKINNKSLGSQDKLLITTIIEIINASENNIEIIFDFSSEKILRIDYIIAVCEQLNHEKISKLKITHGKISEQTELKNKIDKKIFKKIEIENLITSV